jgi:hypothetical protein
MKKTLIMLSAAPVLMAAAPVHFPDAKISGIDPSIAISAPNAAHVLPRQPKPKVSPGVSAPRPAKTYTSKLAEFPNPDHSWVDAPHVVSPSHVAGVLPGMSKRQVYHVLGSPHFNEGIGAQRWNYLFNLRGAQCQMRLHFDDAHVTQIEWRTPECAAAAK